MRGWAGAAASPRRRLRRCWPDTGYRLSSVDVHAGHSLTGTGNRLSTNLAKALSHTLSTEVITAIVEKRHRRGT